MMQKESPPDSRRSGKKKIKADEILLYQRLHPDVD
jgi:hypothetical protein